MNTSSSNSLWRFKLLLFYLTLVLSAHHVNSSAVEPDNSKISLETLPSAISTNSSKTNRSSIETPADTTPNLQAKIDPDESSEAEYEDDLDGSAASPNINIFRVESKNSNRVEEQVAAPSITTVHQVWASSSSDSLDELSPEVISKLRNDVPFLAAYSIRPRLVGASSIPPDNQQTSAALVHPSPYGNQLQTPSVAASEVAASRTEQDIGRLSLQTGAASSPQTSLSKLGNFNEFKVETSSTSKSEHHHKRKTVLKRKGANQQSAELGSRKRQVSNTANQLTAKRHRKGRKNEQNLGKRLKSNQKHLRDLQRSGRLLKRARSAAQKNQAKTSRLRRKLFGRNMRHHLNIIKHGRYFQDAETRGKDSSETVKGGVKGDSVVGSKRAPFYSRAKPASKGDEANEESPPDNSLSDDKPATGGDSVGDKSTSSEGAEEEREEEEEGDDDDSPSAAQPEPRRVGDDDVEEGGDTVSVMPKYDGIDDDPEPPVDEEDGSRSSEREESSGDGKGGGTLGEKDDGSEPRTRRVNRERPNQADNGSSMGQDGSALGGGVGTTIGGDRSGGSGTSAQPDGSEYDGKGMRADRAGSDSADDANEPPSNDGQSGAGVRGGSDTQDDLNPDEREPARDIERIGGGKSAGDERQDDSGGSSGDDKTDRGSEGDSLGRGGGKKSGIEDELPDVDYRDEMAAAGAGRKKGPQPGEAPKETTPSKMDKDCDDGHYNHHDDHHSHHHDHHDTIKWLQDAIPGEPGEDYPILTKANSTDFNCRNQKYPGYYADVGARCQIFHICQADGRQDSFLCPNGTIFSQISSVCVWWNSFDCEDAPKYYKLNELLYKSRPRTSSISDEEDAASQARSRDQTTELRPLGVEAPRANGGGNENDDDEPSIDSLIRDMQQHKAIGRQDGDRTGVTYAKGPSTRIDAAGSTHKMDSSIGGAYDEANVQRKSTNPIDEDLSGLDEASARLRRKGQPRRKRRASAKQSPRKLKPGRYVRRRPVGKTINKIRGPATKQKRRA